MKRTIALNASVAEISRRFDPEVLLIAVTVDTCKHLIENLAAQTKVNMQAMVKTLDKCVESHLIEHDIHPHTVRDAIAAIHQAA